jgi:IS30 family transposase
MSKKRSFKHFDEAARTVIEITENGFNITGKKAAEFLLCSEAAINEEVKRNYYFGKYSASKAQEASKKRKNKTKKRPILEDPKIGKYIEEKAQFRLDS